MRGLLKNAFFEGNSKALTSVACYMALTFVGLWHARQIIVFHVSTTKAVAGGIALAIAIVIGIMDSVMYRRQSSS